MLVLVAGRPLGAEGLRRRAGTRGAGQSLHLQLQPLHGGHVPPCPGAVADASPTIPLSPEDADPASQVGQSVLCALGTESRCPGTAPATIPQHRGMPRTPAVVWEWLSAFLTEHCVGEINSGERKMTAERCWESSGEQAQTGPGWRWGQPGSRGGDSQEQGTLCGLGTVAVPQPSRWKPGVCPKSAAGGEE